MLCDDVVYLMRHEEQIAKHQKVETEATAKIIELSERFVLSPHTVSTVDDLADADAIEKSRGHLFAPSLSTWIEWREGNAGSKTSNRHGVLLFGTNGSIKKGEGVYAFDHVLRGGRSPVGVPILWDFTPGVGDIFKDTSHGELREILKLSVDFAQLGVWVGAALALINTPRISEAFYEDRRKLNARRYAQKKPALLSWKEVRIRIDHGQSSRNDIKGEHGETPYHHVRSHLRLRLGKVELVKSHYRGNPEKGIIKHRYAVMRAEDEGGEWKGGPLPFPEFLNKPK